MKKKFVPDEILIGLRQDYHYEKGVQIIDGIQKLAYFTFMENGKINSQISWDDWRSKKIEPVVLKNEFVEGWKFEENFHQRNGQSNRKLFVMTEPRTGYQFELDVAPAVKLFRNITIKDGVIQGKYAFTRNKSLISETEYDSVKDNLEIKYITSKTIKSGDVVLRGPKQERFVFVGKRYGLNSVYGEDEIPTEMFYLFVSLESNKFSLHKDFRAYENFKYKTQGEYCSDWTRYLEKTNSYNYYYYVSEVPIKPEDKFKLKIEKTFRDYYCSGDFCLDEDDNQLYRSTTTDPQYLTPLKFNGRHFEIAYDKPKLDKYYRGRGQVHINKARNISSVSIKLEKIN